MLIQSLIVLAAQKPPTVTQNGNAAYPPPGAKTFAILLESAAWLVWLTKDKDWQT
jgi:hypothetical protein